MESEGLPLVVRARPTGDRWFDMETSEGLVVTTFSGKTEPGQAPTTSPMELMLVGLAGCVADTYTQILTKMRFEFDDFEVRVHGVRAEKPPRVWTSIAYEVEFRGDVPIGRAEHALNLTERTCPASVMLGRATSVTARVSVVAPIDG